MFTDKWFSSYWITRHVLLHTGKSKSRGTWSELSGVPCNSGVLGHERCICLAQGITH